MTAPHRALRGVMLGLALGGALACSRAPEQVPAAILYSQATPTMRAALPAEKCSAFPVEGFKNPGVRAKTVVLAGHSLPPTYVDQPASAIAQAITSFEPELVVLDTCYGASTPILEAFVDAGLKAMVVAPPYRIPQDGFVYAAGFLEEPDAAKRAELVRTEPSYPLLRWTPTRQPLAQIRHELDALDAQALRKRLKRATPPLVKAQVPGLPMPGAQVLVPLPVDRFRVTP